MSSDERIDADPDAWTNDTRLRIREDGDDYVLVRERYCLVEFETEGMSDTDRSFERYDWSTEDRFVLHGETQAQQVAQMLESKGAFDLATLFHRQLHTALRTQGDGAGARDGDGS